MRPPRTAAVAATTVLAVLGGVFVALGAHPISPPMAGTALAITAAQPAAARPTPPTPTPPAAAAPAVASPTRASVTGARALALITYPWTRLGYQITFRGPKDGFLGLTDCSARHIDIYVTPDQTVTQVEFVTAFEIAHAVDCTHSSVAREAKWPALRGFHLHGAWFPDCACAEDSYPSGDFAEVFARWQAGAAYPWRSTLAPAPTGAQITALVPFLQG